MASVLLSTSASMSSASVQQRRLPLPRSRVSSSLVFKADSIIIASKMSISMCLNRQSVSTTGFEASAALNYTEDQPEQFIDEPLKLDPTMEPVDAKEGTDTQIHDAGAPQQRKGAKIHDFCLGIPFGGIVFVGGLVGFLISRNLVILKTDVLSGGAILTLGVFSLKVWRKGLSSLPFILGQAAIAATLFWKHFHSYSSTKKLFPSGFYIFMSTAMLCFYSYVLLAGGNPPPKTKKLATTPNVA